MQQFRNDVSFDASIEGDESEFDEDDIHQSIRDKVKRKLWWKRKTTYLLLALLFVMALTALILSVDYDLSRKVTTFTSFPDGQQTFISENCLL